MPKRKTNINSTQNPLPNANAPKINHQKEKPEGFIATKEFAVKINKHIVVFKQGTSKPIGGWYNKLLNKEVLDNLISNGTLKKDEKYSPNTERALERINNLKKTNTPAFQPSGNSQTTNVNPTPLSNTSTVTTPSIVEPFKETSLPNASNWMEQIQFFMRWGQFLKQTTCPALHVFQNSYHTQTILKDETDVQIFIPDLYWDNINRCLTHVHSISNSSYKVAAIIHYNSNFFTFFANYKNGSLTIDIMNSHNNESDLEIIKSKLPTSAQVSSFNLREFIHTTNNHTHISMALTHHFFATTFTGFNIEKINNLCTRDRSDSAKQQTPTTGKHLPTNLNTNPASLFKSPKPDEERKHDESNNLNTTVQNSNNNSTPVLGHPIHESSTYDPLLEYQSAPALLNGISVNSQVMPSVSFIEKQAADLFYQNNFEHLTNFSIYKPQEEIEEDYLQQENQDPSNEFWNDFFTQ